MNTTNIYSEKNPDMKPPPGKALLHRTNFKKFEVNSLIVLKPNKVTKLYPQKYTYLTRHNSKYRSL